MSTEGNRTREEEDLLRRAGSGDVEAIGALFARHRPRLERMLAVRLDRRLHRRVDTSDVLQEMYIEMARRMPEYLGNASVPFYVWLRSLAGQRLVALYRRHVGTRMRAVDLEVSLHQGGVPQASSLSLAEQLAGGLTSPTQAASREEQRLRLQQVLNTLEPLDREIIAMRHFEELSNIEVAEVLGIQKSAASKRYLRAVRRLREALAGIPGFLEE